MGGRHRGGAGVGHRVAVDRGRACRCSTVFQFSQRSEEARFLTVERHLRGEVELKGREDIEQFCLCDCEVFSYPQ